MILRDRPHDKHSLLTVIMHPEASPRTQRAKYDVTGLGFLWGLVLIPNTKLCGLGHMWTDVSKQHRLLSTYESNSGTDSSY